MQVKVAEAGSVIVANLTMLVNRLLKKVFLLWFQVYMFASTWNLTIILPPFISCP